METEIMGKKYVHFKYQEEEKTFFALPILMETRFEQEASYIQPQSLSPLSSTGNHF